MDYELGWIRPLVFILIATWVFTYLLWDIVLALMRSWQRDANIFELKAEIQGFVLLCLCVGWGLYYLYGWFEKPDLAAWLVGAGFLLIAGWFNRVISKKWSLHDWGPLKHNQPETPLV